MTSAPNAADRRKSNAPGAADGGALVDWYDRHRRDLPWRTAAGAADPYRVWLSEVMLQQTTVAAVKPYFQAFTSRWPTVDALAAAGDADVMAAWAGLGYYARARNLLACARAVVAAGTFPSTREGLRSLPGIGDYTSAAIAAIAFGEPAVVVDGNVERVAARLVRLDRPPKAARSAVEAVVGAMMPSARPGDFAQAMMDLGATICTPRTPVCSLCPLRPSCAAAAAGDPLAFPVRVPKRPRATWHGVAFVPIRPNGTILLRRRPEAGLLGGMDEVFGSPWGPTVNEPLVHAPFESAWRLAGSVAHGFTHAVLTLDVYLAAAKADAHTPAGARWETPATVGLPTLMRKVVERAVAMHETPAVTASGRDGAVRLREPRAS